MRKILTISAPILILLCLVMRPLITHADDVTFNSAKGVGGAGTDYSTYVQVASSGNVYVLGQFTGTVDLDPGPGVSNLTSTGTSDYFVAKFDSSGNFVWAKDVLAVAGATGNRSVYSLYIDASENFYVTGFFRATGDFDPGPGTVNISPVGGNDMFISKLDSSGNLVWAKSVGSTDNDFGYAVAADSSSNVYIAGGFKLTADFDPGAGTNNLTSAGGVDTYILKLDSSGNFVSVQSIGSTGDDYGQSLLRDSSGNMYIGGFFNNTVDFDPGAGTTNLTSAGGKDIYVLKLDSSNNFVWAQGMGGTGNDIAQLLLRDASGNIYIKGEFTGTADFDPGAGTTNLTSVNASDVFVAKLDSSGNFVWAKDIPTSLFTFLWGRPIALDSYNNLYLIGAFTGTVDFDPGAGTNNIISAGSDDAFVLKLDSSGNFVWVKTMGSTGGDGAYSIALDTLNNIYLGGYFNNTVDFDPGAGVSNLVSNGGYDMFLARYNFLDTTPPVISLVGSSEVRVLVETNYTDAGATATDAVDGSLTSSIATSNSVNTLVPGTYTVRYNVTDAAGNHATEVTRTVIVYSTHHSSGGGGGSYIPPTETTTQASVVAAVPLPVVIPAPIVQPIGKFIFTKTLRLGSNNNEVLELQKFLNAAGYECGPIDGKFGPLTDACARAFQKANPPLKLDGIVGPLTRAVLNR